MKVLRSARGQVMPGPSVPISRDAFEPSEETVLRWLGNAGVLVHSRSTNLMIDPLLEGFDMPLLIEPPILPQAVPCLDGVLISMPVSDVLTFVISVWLIRRTQAALGKGGFAGNPAVEIG